MKSLKQLLLLAISLFLCASCVTTKNITYFQGLDPLDSVRYSTLKTIDPIIPTIQPDDILSITVSSLSDESNQVFNYPNINPIVITNFPGLSTTGTARMQPLGFLVEPDGSIEMPLIGKIKIVNLDLAQATSIIRVELSKFLKEPTVNIRFLNQKFTVIGEVNRPGIYNLLNNHTTLPEVIGTAGELTIYGRRDNVMLMRTTEGKREIIKINLNSREVLESPYYYIRNNDVLYVEPTKGRVTSSDRTLQLIPIVTGITTSFVLLMNFLFTKI